MFASGSFLLRLCRARTDTIQIRLDSGQAAGGCMRTFILSETAAINLSLSVFIRFGFSHHFRGEIRKAPGRKTVSTSRRTSNGVMRNLIPKANCGWGGGPARAGKEIHTLEQ